MGLEIKRGMLTGFAGQQLRPGLDLGNQFSLDAGFPRGPRVLVEGSEGEGHQASAAMEGGGSRAATLLVILASLNVLCPESPALCAGSLGILGGARQGAGVFPVPGAGLSLASAGYAGRIYPLSPYPKNRRVRKHDATIMDDGYLRRFLSKPERIGDPNGSHLFAASGKPTFPNVEESKDPLSFSVTEDGIVSV